MQADLDFVEKERLTASLGGGSGRRVGDFQAPGKEGRANVSSNGELSPAHGAE